MSSGGHRMDNGAKQAIGRKTTKVNVNYAKIGGSSTADMHHATRWLEETGFADVMAGFLALDDTANPLAHLLVGGTTTHQAQKVVIALGEQAGADFAVRGEADAAAMTTKGA